MERRRFISSVPLLIAGTAVTPNAAVAAGSTPIRPVRSFHLLEHLNLETPGTRWSVQRLLSDQARLLMLASCRVANVTRDVLLAGTLDGTMLWRRDLPDGIYTAMGRMSGNIWVFGMTGPAGPGLLSPPSRRLQVFDIDTGNNRPDEFPGLADGFDDTSQHCSVGDSLLELTKAGEARMWSVSNSRRTLQWTLNGLGSSSKHIMLLAPELVAFLGRPDALLTTLNIRNGASAQYRLDCPDIRESFDKFGGVLNNMVGVSRRATPSVIFAAASDGQGTGFALLSPFSAEYVGRVIAFDVTGQCRAIAALGLKPSSLPAHLIPADRELGILCSDGTLDWYALS